MKKYDNKWSVLAAVFISCSALANARAELVSIGTTAGGANAQVGASIASIVSSHTNVRMRPQKASGGQQVLEMVNRGRAQFGVASIMQYQMAVTGTGLSAGQPPMDNLRLVATLMPFVQGVIVRRESGINSIADLRNKRIPVGYLSSPLFTVFWKAFLATEALSYDDVSGVPVASLPKSWDMFKEGQVDAVIAAAGSAAVREMAAVISGGIRYISINETNQLLVDLPATHIEKIGPEKTLDGIIESTNMHVYEYVLFTNAGVSNEIVADISKGLYENNSSLRATTALWKDYDPESIAMDFGLDYHRGAGEYYRSKKLWNQSL